MAAEFGRYDQNLRGTSPLGVCDNNDCDTNK